MQNANKPSDYVEGRWLAIGHDANLEPDTFAALERSQQSEVARALYDHFYGLCCFNVQFGEDQLINRGDHFVPALTSRRFTTPSSNFRILVSVADAVFAHTATPLPEVAPPTDDTPTSVGPNSRRQRRQQASPGPLSTRDLIDKASTRPSQRYNRISELVTAADGRWDGTPLIERCDPSTTMEVLLDMLSTLRDYEHALDTALKRFETFSSAEDEFHQDMLNFMQMAHATVVKQTDARNDTNEYIRQMKTSLSCPTRSAADAAEAACVMVYRLQGKGILGHDCQLFRFDVTSKESVAGHEGVLEPNQQYFVVNELVASWGLDCNGDYYAESYAAAVDQIRKRQAVFSDKDHTVVKVRDDQMKTIFSFTEKLGNKQQQIAKFSMTLRGTRGTRLVPKETVEKYMVDCIHGKGTNEKMQAEGMQPSGSKKKKGRSQAEVFTENFQKPTPDQIREAIQWLFTADPLACSAKVEDWAQFEVPADDDGAAPSQQRQGSAKQKKKDCSKTKKRSNDPSYISSDEEEGSGVVTNITLNGGAGNGAGPSSGASKRARRLNPVLNGDFVSGDHIEDESDGDVE